MAQQEIAEATDWLDEFCWRCGSEEVRPSHDGRILCHACRGELFGPPRPLENAVTVMHRLYWGSHPLERCWRCMTRSVDPKDELGLCSKCR
jgi:hypothetical protein